MSRPNVPGPDPGEFQSFVLSANIGHAISAFSMIELGLLTLFANCLGLPHPVAARMLAPVRNFSTSLDIIDIAVRHRLSTTIALPFWLSLLDYIRELSGDRNYMAHTPLVMHSAPADGKPGPKVGPGMLFYFTGEPGRIGPMPPEEVSELLLDFEEASNLTSDISMGLAQSFDERFSRPIVRRRPPRGKRQAAAQPKR